MYYIPQNGGRNRLDNAEIKRRFEAKEGRWEMLYPGIEDINKLSIKADVKCLDCGKEQNVRLHHWLNPKNLTNGCQYCGPKKAGNK